MCGIAGCLGLAALDAKTQDRILDSLRHRGPDGRHARTWPDATLLHTRLRIIDLSRAGDQPLSNEDGSAWAVFNGGHRFRGRSDTEVLPHLYEEYGDEMFGRLRGMFSIAIFDTRERRLLIARDRFGIKPLFYATTTRGLAFASEIRITAKGAALLLA